MPLKTVPAHKDLSFLHVMENMNLNVFGKLRRSPLSLKEWQALWSVLDTVGVQSHSTGDILPSLLMVEKPEGSRGPQHPCFTIMTEGIVRYMPGGSPPQSPACTQEQLAPLRFTHRGHKNSHSHFFPNIQIGLRQIQIGFTRT